MLKYIKISFALIMTGTFFLLGCSSSTTSDTSKKALPSADQTSTEEDESHSADHSSTEDESHDAYIVAISDDENSLADTSTPNKDTLDSQTRKTTQQTSTSTSKLVYQKQSKCSGVTCPNDCFSLDRGRLHTIIFGYKKILTTGRTLRAKAVWPPAFNPPSNTKLPVIAFFHGGGLDNPRMTYDYWSPALNYFASRGMLAISFEYRLASRKLSQRSAKEPVLDARSAIRWIRKHAELLSANPDKIVTAGNSAGGYLALAVGVMDGVNDETGADLRISPKPRIIFSGYPMIDLTLHNYEAEFSLKPKHAKRLPRTYILQEVRDPVTVTPPRLTKSFCNSAPERCGYITINSTPLMGGHIHDLFGPAPTYPIAMSHLDSFMIRNNIVAGVASKTLGRVKTARAHCRR